MFKKFCMLALGLSLSVALGTGNAQSATIFKVGLGDPLEAGAGAFGLKFKELLEKKTNGEVKVELFPNCSLGDEPEMLQNVRRGTLDMTVVGIGNAVPMVPGLAALTMPYLLESEADVVKATTGKLFQHFSDMSAKQGGFRILGYCYSNFRHLTNSKRPVTSLADLKGLKIRVPNNKIFVATYTAWGGNPVPMGWAEVFTALQQGVIDGQDNPYVVNHSVKFEEVQKYLTELHYQYSLQPLFIGEKTFKKLSPEIQKAVSEAGIEAQAYVLQWENEHSLEARKAMEAKGVKVSTLTDEAEWKKLAVEKVWPEYYEFVGGKAAVDMILKDLGK